MNEEWDRATELIEDEDDDEDELVDDKGGLIPTSHDLGYGTVPVKLLAILQ